VGKAAALHRQPQPAELLTDLGLGKRIAGIVAKRLMTLLGNGRAARCAADQPRALHRARERVAGRPGAGRQRERLGAVRQPAAGRCRATRSSATSAAAKAWWCTPTDCAVAKRLQHKDSERFIGVEWADEPVRPFETGVLVTVANGKGVLARVAAALANAEADITHVDMDDERAQDATDLRFVIAVRDRTHLDSVLRNLKRTPSVMNAQRPPRRALRPG
jgi:guanosine-3',5'-bis(diphosphate) 3'-pyrophosphohydrolase